MVIKYAIGEKRAVSIRVADTSISFTLKDFMGVLMRGESIKTIV